MMQRIRFTACAAVLALLAGSCAPVEKVRKQTYKGPAPREDAGITRRDIKPGSDIPAENWGQKKSKPYAVAGVTYYPLETAEGYSEEGTASWYGPDFHGKATANGEEYNQEGYTAAHKTLPFNTLVRVENLRNGKNVVVRVNDRGPFVSDRIIDVSRAAASDLGMMGTGTAKVRLSVDGEAGGSSPTRGYNHSKMRR